MCIILLFSGLRILSESYTSMGEFWSSGMTAKVQWWLCLSCIGISSVLVLLVMLLVAASFSCGVRVCMFLSFRVSCISLLSLLVIWASISFVLSLCECIHNCEFVISVLCVPNLLTMCAICCIVSSVSCPACCLLSCGWSRRWWLISLISVVEVDVVGLKLRLSPISFSFVL